MAEQLDLQKRAIELGKDTPPSNASPVGTADLFWTVYASCYDSIYHLMPYRQLLWDCLQALDLGPGMKLLDAGCGTGNFEKFMLEKGMTDVEVEAVDLSWPMLSKPMRK